MSDVAILTRLVAELSGRLDALSARVPVRIGTPDVPAPNLVVEVIQSAHGFTIGQVVTNTGVSWNLAVAGDDSIGVVCKVVDADTVWICEWGIVCITGASFAESSVYYLGATAGTPTTTPGTPKRAVFFAVSPTMLLVTNPAKDAAGGGLDAITGPAVLGKAAAGSGVPTAIPAAADDTILGRRAGALTYAKIATAEIADGAVTAIKLAATAVTPAAYGSATQVATFTVDQQGRITLAANVTLTPAWASVTGKPTTLAGYGITDGALSARTISAGTGLSGGGDLTADRTVSLANTSVSAGNYGSGTAIPVLSIDAQGRITSATTSAVTPTSGSSTVTSDTADTTDSAALSISGTFYAWTLNLWEKRPRFNAKWLLGNLLDASVGSNPTDGNSFLWFDKTNSRIGKFRFFNDSAVTGWINCYDSTAGDNKGLMTGVMSGKAYTLLGRSAGTDGLPDGIGASPGVSAAEGTVMQRAVGGNLAFATNIVLGKAGSGGSLGGWKVNASTSATASEWEASGSTNSLTAKYSGTTVLEVKAGATQQIVLKNTSGTAGTTIQIDWSGNSPRLQMFRPDISTMVPMIDLNLATAPTGGWTTAKAMGLREEDACDNSGTLKKRMILASALY